MEENQLSECELFISKILEDSRKYESEYKYGSNRKSKINGLKKLKDEMSLFEYYVEKNPKLYDLITGINSNDYDKFIIWDELMSVQFFVRDLNEIIKKMSKKVL